MLFPLHRIDKRVYREIAKAADKPMAIAYYANIDRLCYKAMVRDPFFPLQSRPYFPFLHAYVSCCFS